MEKVVLGRTGLKVSNIAFGGIPIMRVPEDQAVTMLRSIIDMGVNFIDTAHGYSDSEEKIGKAIKPLKREEIILSSKSPAGDGKTFNEHLELSLNRLKVDYIDIYHLHNVSSKKQQESVFASNGAFPALMKAIEQGKVRYPAFSSHSLTIASEMIKTDNFDVTQIPFNFVDDAAAKEVIPLARSHTMGFISMKPLGGGLLDNARLCFKFLKQYEGIVPDPGIEKLEEMVEILEIMKDPTPLTEEDKSEIERIRAEMGDKWCHRCEYCQPCPQEIKIHMVLNLKSTMKRMSFDKLTSFMSGFMDTARECIECGECVERCPYNLDIPNLIKDYIEVWDEFVESGGRS